MIKEFLREFAHCIDCGELEKCVEVVEWAAGEMGIGAKMVLK